MPYKRKTGIRKIHFEFTTKKFYKADELIHYLKEKAYLPDYEKDNHFYNLIKNNLSIATENAINVRKYHQPDISNGIPIYELNPYTNVDILVQYLLGLGEI